MTFIADRMIVWVEVGRGVVVEPEDVYWLEAKGAATWVRLRGRDRIRDRRSLGKVVESLAVFGFLRVHKNHAVNLRRVQEIRRRSPGGDWEVKLEPPVNRVLPVARGRERELLAAFEAGNRNGRENECQAQRFERSCGSEKGGPPSGGGNARTVVIVSDQSFDHRSW